MAGAKHTYSFHLNRWWPSLLTHICVTMPQCVESNPQRNNVLEMESIKFVTNVSYSLLIEYSNISKVSLDMEILWRHCVYEIIAVIILDWWVVIVLLNKILMTVHNVHKNYVSWVFADKYIVGLPGIKRCPPLSWDLRTSQTHYPCPRFIIKGLLWAIDNGFVSPTSSVYI